MVMHVALHHRTSYRYDRLVALGPQLVRLRPAPHCRTRVLAYALAVRPTRHFVNWQQDPHANWQARFVFPDKTDHFEVEVDLVAEMAALNPFDFFVEPNAEHWPFVYEPKLHKDLEPYLETIRPGPLLRERIAAIPRARTGTVAFLVELNRQIAREVRYLIRMEPGMQTPEETLGLGSGSCRDSSWLLVQILRHLGLAARFVSGYLIQLVPDVKALDGPSGPEADFTDLHAWAEVYLPGAGWIGLDPTSGLLAGEGHLPLACTPDPETAAPISGLVDPCEVAFSFSMAVRRIWEQPRVTKPYGEEQWQAILAAGDRVDAALDRGDVRLTMGGEPTFVGIDARDAPEWNTTATGPAKRARADDLVRRLMARLAPGGLLHHGQGKWYPGEQLPRWAFSLYWRTDGVSLWSRPELIAGEGAGTGADIAAAERFARGLAERLGVDPDAVLPAFEDPAHFLLREHQLPENLDPLDNRLDDPMERQRLARVVARGQGAGGAHVEHVDRVAVPAGEAVAGVLREGRHDRQPVVDGVDPVAHRLPVVVEEVDVLGVGPPGVAEECPPVLGLDAGEPGQARHLAVHLQALGRVGRQVAGVRRGRRAQGRVQAQGPQVGLAAPAVELRYGRQRLGGRRGQLLQGAGHDGEPPLQLYGPPAPARQVDLQPRRVRPGGQGRVGVVDDQVALPVEGPPHAVQLQRPGGHRVPAGGDHQHPDGRPGVAHFAGREGAAVADLGLRPARGGQRRQKGQEQIDGGAP